MTVDVARRGRHRQGEDRAEEPRDRATDHEGEHHGARMKVGRVALDLGHEDVVLDLLDGEVKEEGGPGGLDPGGRRDEDGRDGGDDRADDRQQLEESGDHREKDREAAEHRVDDRAEEEEAGKRRQADRQAENDLAADPRAEDPPDDRNHGIDVGAPLGRDRCLEPPNQGRPVLQEVERPDRDDEEGEHRPDEPGGGAQDRQEDRRIEADVTGRELRQPLVDGIPDRGWQLEPAVDGTKSLQLRPELVHQAGQVGREQADLVHERPEHQVQALDDGEDGHRVHGEDGEGPGGADPGQSLDRRGEQIDDQEPDDERAEGLAPGIEDDPDHHGRGREQRHPRRHRWEASCGGDHPSGRLAEPWSQPAGLRCQSRAGSPHRPSRVSAGVSGSSAGPTHRSFRSASSSRPGRRHSSRAGCRWQGSTCRCRDPGSSKQRPSRWEWPRRAS